MTSDSQRTLEDYGAMGAAYADDTDRDPMKVGYERPAMLAMAGDLRGKRVLDVGCASGAMSHALVECGAQVVGIDLNAEFLAHARRRVGQGATFQVADISKPMPQLTTGSFDVVTASLVIHYLQDWTTPLAEFHRMLAPHGVLALSTHHPAIDLELVESSESYFETVLLTDTWRKAGRDFTVRYYHRPLSAIVDAIARAGFVIDRMPEPQPDAKAFNGQPELLAKVSARPWFLFIRAIKRSV